MSISLEECYDCGTAFQDSMDPVCPVCTLRKEMEKRIGSLEKQVEELLIVEERRLRARPIG